MLSQSMSHDGKLLLTADRDEQVMLWIGLFAPVLLGVTPKVVILWLGSSVALLLTMV